MTRSDFVCIDLDQPQLEGFRQFISAWLVRRGNATLVVDPGPLSTIPTLLAALQKHGVTRLDYILLTHIHIDHAGGAGALLAAFPEAQVICHPEGVRHLVAPQKLWQGSQQVLGKLAEVYGEIVAIPEERIGFAEQIGATGIRAYLTPGHAVHHCCYQLGDLLFAGEVAGVRAELKGEIFMRPATPPRFILEVALDSLDRMRALKPQSMVFAHYGLVDNAAEHLDIGWEQLRLWVRGAAATAGQPEREAALIAWLRQRDAVYRRVDLLPADIQARERYFLGNTLRGMIEYVDGLSEEARQELVEG